MLHDVIVVGSGPGGAIAAATLAEQGKSVLLVDRQSFPRDKVCGDGMPVEVMKMLRELGIDMGALDYHRVYSLTITGPNGRAITTQENPHDSFSMTAPRYSFDHALHNHALQQGAHFEQMQIQEPLCHDGRVIGVIERRGGQRIEHEARVVIAAGGVGSPLARSLQKQKPSPEARAISIRAYVRLKQPMEPCVQFFFEPGLLPGYAWIFPIAGQRANVGVYIHNSTYKQGALDLRALFDDFCARLAEDYAFEIEPETLKSWSLPIYVADESRTTAGVMFVGDEGNFTNALTGGGIYTAMMTGRLAGEQAVKLLDSLPADYDAAWREAVAPDLRRGRFVQKHIASHALRLNSLIALGRNPLLKYRLMKAIAGDHY
ncbi:MAG: geranylgeranyl reductase family protein [Anaerolineae bacterium]|nr:geranylgeranyl reductase family protein [Anaerolineae bacterium]